MIKETVYINNFRIDLIQTSKGIYAKGADVLKVFGRGHNVKTDALLAGIEEGVDVIKLGTKPIWYVTPVGIIMLVNRFGTNNSLLDLANAMDEGEIVKFKTDQLGSLIPKKKKKKKKQLLDEKIIEERIYARVVERLVDALT